MNNRGVSKAVVVLIIVAVIVVIISAVTIFIVLNQKSIPGLTSKNSIPRMNLYLDAFDSSGNAIDGNYTVLNGTNMLAGQLFKNTYSEIKNVSNGSIVQILCQSQGYYSDYINKTFDSQELLYNLSRVDCKLKHIGSLNVYSSGNLTEDVSTITLGIYPTGYYNNLEICTSWTPGIIDISLPFQPQISCSVLWNNLTENLYYCSADKTFQYCDSVAGNNCILKQMEIPNRLSGIADKCFYLGTNLKDNSTQVSFGIHSRNLNTLDSIDFYIFDNDLFFNQNKGSFDISSEFNGQRFGSGKDIPYEILPKI